MQNPWVAWQFDNAVSTFGGWVEGKMKERDKRGKPKHDIEKLLGIKKARRKVSARDFMARGVPVKFVPSSQKREA